MLKLYPLFSGSSGNMYVVSANNTNIIVDIGVSYKKCIDALSSIKLAASDIDALFITHEHVDHIKGLVLFINKNENIPIYLTKGTKEYILLKYSNKLKVTPLFKEIKYGKTINVKEISVTSIETSHDACMPTSYNFKYKLSSLTIATDLGYINENLYNHLARSNFSVIESNYDKNLLYYGNYSYPLKKRIDSKIGHLSNEDMANVLVELAKIGKRDFLLAHISENNNSIDQVLSTAVDAITMNGFNINDFNINIASRNLSQEVYEL